MAVNDASAQIAAANTTRRKSCAKAIQLRTVNIRVASLQFKAAEPTWRCFTMHLGQKESVNRLAHLTRNMGRVKVRLAILASPVEFTDGLCGYHHLSLSSGRIRARGQCTPACARAARSGRGVFFGLSRRRS